MIHCLEVFLYCQSQKPVVFDAGSIENGSAKETRRRHLVQTGVHEAHRVVLATERTQVPSELLRADRELSLVIGLAYGLKEPGRLL